MIRKAIFFIFFPTLLLSQNTISSYNSLNLNSSSRILSLGGESISIIDDDVSLASITPSLLNPSMDKQVSFNFVDYFFDINFISIYFAKELSEDLMIFSGLDAINYGQFTSTDEIGNSGFDFSANQQLFTIGVSKYLGKNFTLGSNIKMLNSNLETYHSITISSNISTTYYLKKKNFSCTFLFKNIGRPLKKYTTENESLPFEIQMGVSKSLEHLPFRYSLILHHLHVYDISNDFFPNTIYDPITNSVINKDETIAKKLLRHVILGGELNPFRKNLYLRAGFNFQRREDLKLSSSFSMNGFSWGLGFSIKKIQIDYSRSAFHSSSMINSFSVLTNLSTFGL